MTKATSGPRPVEGELEHEVQELGARENERKERGLDQEPAAVQRHARHRRDCERDRGTAEKGEEAEELRPEIAPLEREPAGEVDVPTSERVVRDVVLGDVCERERGEARRHDRNEQPPLSRGVPCRRGT